MPIREVDCIWRILIPQVPIGDSYWECRFLPPIMIGTTGPPDREATFPRMPDDCWCSNYKSRERFKRLHPLITDRELP